MAGWDALGECTLDQCPHPHRLRLPTLVSDPPRSCISAPSYPPSRSSCFHPHSSFSPSAFATISSQPIHVGLSEKLMQHRCSPPPSPVRGYVGCHCLEVPLSLAKYGLASASSMGVPFLLSLIRAMSRGIFCGDTSVGNLFTGLRPAPTMAVLRTGKKVDQA